LKKDDVFGGLADRPVRWSPQEMSPWVPGYVTMVQAQGQLGIHTLLRLHTWYQAPWQAGPKSWSLRLLPAPREQGRSIKYTRK
jgi:hypothetical protein